MFVVRPVLLIAVLLCSVVRANICRDSAACCRVIDFEAPSANTATPFAATDFVEVPAGNNSLWWAGTGIALSVDETPSSGSPPYALGLFNSSRIPYVAATGADLLHTTSERLVLSAFNHYSSSLLRYTQTLRFRMWNQPACVARVVGLRSVTFSEHASSRFVTTRIAADGTRTDVAAHSFPYQVSQTSNIDVFEFSGLSIDELRIEITGQGYGALASVEVCFHPPRGYDTCAICSGDDTGCAEPGGPCNTHMAGVCAQGTYNDQLNCIPNLASMPEQCNGLDDNCDGIIDNGDFGVWSCGVGQCARTVDRCQSGVPVANTTCVPGAPAEEVCNGLDDNCNGLVDEGDVCVSASTTPSASPWLSASPTRPPSATPSPQPSRPLLLPLLDCVRVVSEEGYYEAHFGYSLLGPGAQSTTVDAGPNNLLLRAGAPISGQTTHFSAGAPVHDAFAVTFGAGETVQWSLALSGEQTTQSALADSASRRCDADVPLTLECVQPLFQGCVSMLGARCTVALGYYNPNAQTVELPAGAASNWFSPDPVDRRQPRVFAPGLVQSVQQLEFDCGDASWQLQWTLAIGQQACSAAVSAANLC